MKLRQYSYIVPSFLFAISFSPMVLLAQSLTWDTSSTTTGIQDGSGTWAVDSSGWWNGTSNVNWTNGSIATFGSASGSSSSYAITIGSNVGVGNISTNVAGNLLVFQAPGNYSFSAASATVVQLNNNTGTGNGFIRVASGVTTTFGDNITWRRSSNSAGQLNFFGGATAGQNNGGRLVIGSGQANSLASVENGALNLNEIREGLTLEIKQGGRFVSTGTLVLGGTSTADNGFTNTIFVNGGILNVGATAVANNLVIGNSSGANTNGGSTGIVTMSAGEINILSTGANTGLRFGTSTGGSTNIINSTFNLDGGMITVGRIYDAGGNSTINSTFNFNGGVVRVLTATTNASTFMAGLDTARVRNGGAIIDTNGINTTIGQAFLKSDLQGDAAVDGGLEKRGAGSLTMTGAHTYNGNTKILNGSIILGGGNDRLLTTGAVVLGDTSSTGRLVLGDGTARNQTLGGLTTTGLGGSVVGGAAANSSLTLNISSGTNTYSGLLGGEGTNENNLALTKRGSGTLTLTGLNTYTGNTTVAEGALVVNGALAGTSTTTVQAGASIGGSGSVGNLTIEAGGSLNPGNSPGVITVNGDYNQFGTLFAEIGGLAANEYDQVVVNGAVNLSGALTVQFTGDTYRSGDMIFLVLNDGDDAVTGTFASLAQNSKVVSYGGLDWLVSYEANFTGTTNTFTGGNDVALQAIPESSATLFAGLSALLLMRRRRTA